MKVIHIESGLGNQMLSYCEYLALKKMNPNDDFYLETVIYDIPECNEVICQWNGYELERVFGIKEPKNIRSLFTDEPWQDIMSDIRKSEFWLHNWNWPVYFQQAFAENGLLLKNSRGDFEAKGHSFVGIDVNRKRGMRDLVRNTDIYRYLQMKKNWNENIKKAKDYTNESVHFYQSDENELTGQRLSFKFINSGIEYIENEIRRIFTFPAIHDDHNAEMLRYIQGCNSVAIHARRGDMTGFNYPLYRFGYFRRCISFIRSQVDNPEFFIFCDPDSVSWAHENSSILGLNFKNDKIHFIDWNKSLESFRDMQLMTACKHQIITQSSFGWWGAWLNTFPGKITCSPNPLINTTHHFK